MLVFGDSKQSALQEELASEPQPQGVHYFLEKWAYRKRGFFVQFVGQRDGMQSQLNFVLWRKGEIPRLPGGKGAIAAPYEQRVYAAGPLSHYGLSKLAY